MAGKTIGELSESVSLDNTNLLAVSSDGNVLKKTTLSTLENSLTVSNFNATSKATIVGLAMPSSRYINLTLGASGTSYTAPDNGWFVYAGSVSTAGRIHVAVSESLQDSRYSPVNEWAGASVPVHKGQQITFYYTGSFNLGIFKFVYAVGSEPEA